MKGVLHIACNTPFFESRDPRLETELLHQTCNSSFYYCTKVRENSFM